MKDAIEIIKAIPPLIWPIILCIVLWRLFPTIKLIASSRAFSVKIAGMEVSVQDATEQLRLQIEDLQKQVISLRSGAALDTVTSVETPSSAPAAQSAKGPAILWVDDKPSGNAFEIAQLKNRGVEVALALSTADALACLAKRDFAAVVSDMGRREEGAYRGNAGIELLHALKERDPDIAFLVYTGARRLDQAKAVVIGAGGDGATASPVELLEWVARKTGVN
ncbi:response regulator [Sphingomonas sp. LM7]|uniref:response regulator n=1 Tax=Sphingomonas sp. LM7 TaxID=1938607 RepID=UPI0009839037|nr:response regulator [Sphingomonas sp. LM7]AQR74008.1 hypothetical protein BXU08_10430 [Sphingomonas sp. LM7]